MCEDSVRGRMLAVAGVGAVAGMVLWGVVGVRSLAGPTAVFTVVFLGFLGLSAAWEARRASSEQGWGRWRKGGVRCSCLRRNDAGHPYTIPTAPRPAGSPSP